jgi:ornithine carbamoyltransferase
VVGAGRLGATVATFGPGDLQTHTGETLEDTARTFAGYLDVLVCAARAPAVATKPGPYKS